MAKDLSKVAPEVLELIGGKDNVISVVHCMTRLRFNLKNKNIAYENEAKIKKVKNVTGVVKSGGMFQVVIGPDVPLVYQDLIKLGVSGEGGIDVLEVDKEPLTFKKALNNVISVFMRIMGPIIGPLCGVGIVSAIVSILQVATLGNPEGVVLVIYNILNASAQGLFYFIPFLIMVSASKVFKFDTFVGLAVMGALLYAQENTYLAGIIVIGEYDLLSAFTYSSNMLVPIFIALAGGYLYRYLVKVLPGVIRTFFAPALCILILVPATIFIIGPVFGFVGLGISIAFNFIQTIPVVGLPIFGALFGFFWQVLVIFGIHGIIMVPLMQDIYSGNPIFIVGPLMLAVLSQFGAVLAIAVKIKNKERKAAAIGAAVSAAFGVTEPAIYGFTLPKKKPFFIAASVAGVAGLLSGVLALKGGMTGQGFFFLLGYITDDLTVFLSMFLITIGMLATVFFLTYFFYKLDPEDLLNVNEVEEIPANFDTNKAFKVLSPLEGTVISLSSAKDKAFKDGNLGKGVAILPTKFKNIVAPVSGTLVHLADTGHAFGIITQDGIEVLVHIGIDTVKLNGKGFDVKVKQNDEVKAGDLIVIADKDIIARAGYSNETYVVITNYKDFEVVHPELGKKTVKDSVILVGNLEKIEEVENKN
ncbi:MAG: glucose PTS transporter subunit IIA [Acholeplasmatales bacterium]|jgi:PTS system beta-glucosides-specific IIC component|nr:glucose PTS transporter subunit IIA [Acholeplasmatales bacterium]